MRATYIVLLAPFKSIEIWLVGIISKPSSLLTYKTGSRDVLNDKKDVEDCIRILLLALSKIPSKSSYLI